MSSESEITDVISSIANIFLKAVDALEGRLMLIEQRMDELERSLGTGRRDQGPPSQVFPSMPQDNRRAPPPNSPTMNFPPPQPPQRVDAYSNPQPQYGSPRQDNYPQTQTSNYQTRPPQYPPAQQQPYPPPGQPQQSSYGAAPQSQPPQGPPGPRPPTNPLNMRQALTGEIKEVFAKMRARAEGR
jgi:hypothetical protein